MSEREQPDSEASWDDALRAAFGPADGSAQATPEPSVLARLRGRDASVSSVHLTAASAQLPEGPPVRSSSGESFPQGTRLGRYTVVGELAQGGVGIILQGRDTDLGRDVALKVLRERYAGNAELIRRFVEEAQIGGQLQHPGIVPVYELGLDPRGKPFLAMKLVRGRTLARLLADRGDAAQDRPRLVGIFEQIVQTVAYAHARDVVHRDLKPSNVMVGAFGEVQVMDWGFAKVLKGGGHLDDARSLDRTAAQVIATVRSGPDDDASVVGSVLGTPGYMPPEQARGDVAKLDERTDVFALGAILCEILTGSPAHAKDGSRPQIERAAEGDLADAMRRLDACTGDPELVDLARRCLDPDRERRPSHAGLVAREVSRHLEGVEERARAAEVAAAEARVRASAERRSRRLTAALAAAVVVMLVVAGTAAYLVDSGRRAEQRRVEGDVRDALALAAQLVEEEQWVEAERTLEALRAQLDEEPVEAALLAASRRRATELGQRIQRDSLIQRIRDERNDAQSRSFFSGGTRAYEEMFAALGVDVDAGTPAEVAASLGALDEEFATTLALALDDWAWRARVNFRGAGGRGGSRDPGRGERTPREPGSSPPRDREERLAELRKSLEERFQRLLAVAMAVDPDPWRNGLRRAASDGDAERLSELAEEADESVAPVGYDLLATSLLALDRPEAAIAVLERGALAHPDDFGINRRLALFLRFAGSERSQDALRYATVARAIRPSDRQVIRELADLYETLGNDAQAAELRELYDEKQFDYEQDPERKRWLQAFNEIPRSDHEARALSARERLSVDGDDRQAQRELVESLTELGRYDEVLALADSLGAPSASDRGDGDPLADVRRRAALERELDGLDDGEDLTREQLWLRAEVCRQTDRFARAAELYARLLEAPEEERGERNGRRTWGGRSRGWDVRYRAATVAGLAGLGLGRDALGTTPEWRGAQRARALAWARAELQDARDAGSERSRGGSRDPARWIAQRWLDDVRLAPLRDPVRLADLPAEERAAWNELWLGFRELARS